MTDKTTFEPIRGQRTTRDPVEEREDEPKEGWVEAWDLNNQARWQAAGWDAAKWIGALAVATGLVAGLMWALGWTGTWSPERETDRFTLVSVPIVEIAVASTLPWLTASLVAGIRAWRSIEEPSWAQRLGWLGLGAMGLSGIIPILLAIGGGYLAAPYLVLFPPSEGLAATWAAFLGLCVVSAGIGFLFMVGGILIPEAWRRFRTPVLVGFTPSLAVGLSFTLEPSLWWLWIPATVVGLPVAALALWPVCKQEDGNRAEGVTGDRYAVGVLVLWSGLATIAFALISGLGYLLRGG